MSPPTPVYKVSFYMKGCNLKWQYRQYEEGKRFQPFGVLSHFSFYSDDECVVT